MRLLYLSADPGVPVLGQKGASVHVRELSEAFAGLGVSVVVASPRTRFEGDRLDADVALVEIAAVLPKEHGAAGSLPRQAVGLGTAHYYGRLCVATALELQPRSTAGIRSS